MYSTQEGAADCRVGVGVSAAHDRVDDTFLKVHGVEQLPECIAKRNQHPALVTNEIRRWPLRQQSRSH